VEKMKIIEKSIFLLKNKLTPLHISIHNGNSEIVKFLLENGANPNAETLNKITPIQLALQISTEICKQNIIPSYIGEIDIKDKMMLIPTNYQIIKYRFIY
jgi:ankyrin repeat protein